jgi:hypothetical protein
MKRPLIVLPTTIVLTTFLSAARHTSQHQASGLPTTPAIASTEKLQSALERQRSIIPILVRHSLKHASAENRCA